MIEVVITKDSPNRLQKKVTANDLSFDFIRSTKDSILNLLLTRINHKPGNKVNTVYTTYRIYHGYSLWIIDNAYRI